jgi:hypothetical protein
MNIILFNLLLHLPFKFSEHEAIQLTLNSFFYFFNVIFEFI